MTELGDTLQGSASGGDPSASVTIGYDETTLYVVMRVTDKKIVRTAGCRRRTRTTRRSTCRSPRARRTRSGSIRARRERAEGVVKMGGSTVSGAKLVEAPTDKGLRDRGEHPVERVSRGGSHARRLARGRQTHGRGRAGHGEGRDRHGGRHIRTRASAALALDRAGARSRARSRQGAFLESRARGVRQRERRRDGRTRRRLRSATWRSSDRRFAEARSSTTASSACEDASMVTRLELEDFDGDGHRRDRRAEARRRERPIPRAHSGDEGRQRRHAVSGLHARGRHQDARRVTSRTR